MNRAWFRANERLVIAGIVVIALIHGLFYVHLVPPWQHYDEPTHFEYAWMIVDKGELPVPEVYDLGFRSELVRSLIEHDFYPGEFNEPDPNDLAQPPPGLQFPQLDDPPLYYLLASVPIRLSGSTDLADQLIAARYVSLLLLAVTVFSAWGIVSEITSPGSPYRLFVPLTVAMLPGFVDLMTAVNNDVGAVAVFTLFLWGAVRLIRSGPGLVNLLWVILAVLAAIFTKSTAFMAAPLAVIAVILGILPGRLRRYAWTVIGLGILGSAVLLLYLREPAYWYRATSQSEPIRTVFNAAPHGDHVLVLEPSANITPQWLQAINQPLPLEDVNRLRGKNLTLGFWMWFSASDPAVTELSARTPSVNLDLPGRNDPAVNQTLLITRSPQFYAFTVEIPQDALRLWVSMSGKGLDGTAGLKLFYDGIVVAEGVFPVEVPANIGAGEGTAGEWGGAAFDNLLRNGSAEETWPAFRPWADNLSARVLPSNVRLSILLYSLMDRDGAGWYYFGAATNIFETFWGRFGWGHVPLPGGALLYDFFVAATALAVLGVVFYPFGRGSRIPVDPLLFMGLTLILVWFAALARGAIFIFVEHVFQPSARYGFPAIVPTVLALVAGWIGAGKTIVRTLRVPPFYLIAIYVDLLLTLDVLALWGIVRYYSGA